jgi:hypothetical protein
MMRVDRQIHAEFRGEWYGRAWYKAQMKPAGFVMHGEMYSVHRAPPPTLHYIQLLDLSIRLVVPSSYAPHKEPLGLYDPTRLLEMCFASGQSNRLRTLYLRLEITKEFIEFYTGKAAELQEDLASRLAPLTNLHGLEVGLVVTRGDRVGPLFGEDIQPSDEVTRGILDFGRSLVAQIAASDTL